MLRPAVNRQPGFRRGTRRASNAEKNTLIGWLAGSAAGWLAACCLAGWLAAAAADGWLTGCGCLVGLLLLLAGWLNGCLLLLADLLDAVAG